MKARLLLPVALLVAAPLLLSACGGSDDSGGGEDADITEAIEQGVVSDTPESCTQFQTQAFTEQVEAQTGADAVTACEQNAGDGDHTGDSVDVRGIEVDGDSATAEAAITGGNLSGQTLALSLAKEDDQWKLDSIDDFVVFDKDSFVTALGDSIAADPDTPASVAECVTTELGAASEEDIQAAFLSGDQEQVLGLFGACLGG
jgi:hypothetical protein